MSADCAPHQAVLPRHEALVRGGRWDVLAFRHGLGDRICAGLSIYVSKLFAAAQAAPGTAPGRAVPSAAPEVLVCSLGAGLSHARLRLTGELWQVIATDGHRLPLIATNCH